MLFSRLGSLTSCIFGIGVLRRVRHWWIMGVFLIILGDVASVDVDTVGVVVGVSLAYCVFSMIAVKSCCAFACLSFAFVVCYQLGSLTSCIAGTGVLRRVCRWWIMGVFKITLGDVASVDKITLNNDLIPPNLRA